MHHGHSSICLSIVTVTFSKKHDSLKWELMGLATISILFSGMAATTLAASSNHKPTAINQTVNALWFSSILLGICSATSCILGMEWHSITGWTPRPSDPGLVQTFRFIIKALTLPITITFLIQETNLLQEGLSLRIPKVNR